MKKRSNLLFIFISFVIMIYSFYISNIYIFNMFSSLGVFMVLRGLFTKLNIYAISALGVLLSIGLAIGADFSAVILKYAGNHRNIDFIVRAINENPKGYYFSLKSVYIFVTTIFVFSTIKIFYSSPNRLREFLFLIGFNVMILVVCTFMFNNNIKTVNYDIYSHKISEDIKIIHISDTHSTIYKDNQLSELVKTEKPDLILLPGDIADDKRPIEGTKILLNEIKDIAPIYYVTGNHELYDNRYKDRIETVTSYGIQYLNDEFEEINIKNNTILVAGINDPQYKYTTSNYQKTSERLNNIKNQYGENHSFKILLSHRPELYDIYKEFDYEIVLSGHAHGGQIRIPLLINGLFAPNQGFLPKHAGGLYKIDNTVNSKLIVSRGLSIDKLPRIFNPPELVIINLHGTES